MVLEISEGMLLSPVHGVKATGVSDISDLEMNTYEHFFIKTWNLGKTNKQKITK